MAFVNKQAGAEKHETRAGAGQPIDFDPDDPSIVKVHYDLSSWTIDQRAEVAQALAEHEIPHAWDGEELMVPEAVEAAADAMFERLEQEFGPFPIVLDPDGESTEFGLDEWSAADRGVLTDALVESEIPHRWDGTTVSVARDAEDAVDDLLDAIEAGELMSADDVDAGPPENALSDIFLATNRLVKDPLDARSRNRLIDLYDDLDRAQPPYAFPPRPWEQVVAGVAAIVARIESDADGEHADPDDDDRDGGSDVAGLSARLRELLRPFI